MNSHLYDDGLQEEEPKALKPAKASPLKEIKLFGQKKLVGEKA